MRRAGDVGVGQDREELRWGAAEDARSVDVANGARESGGHRLERLIDRAGLRRLDEQHAEIALVPVSAGELVLQHGAHETLVEQAGGAVDDVQRLGMRIIRAHAARWAEDRAGG